MENVLQTKHLTKIYGDYKSVNDVSMTIKKGDIYGFVGKNGAGKTTIIRLITGVVFKTCGEITLYGVSDEQNILKMRRRLAAVVETPSLYGYLNAYDNLLIQANILGIADKSKVAETLNTVGLEVNSKKKVKDFSLGMRQRLGIAIALIGSPDFLILDEPSNGLDPEGIIDIRELLIKLNREQNITILIASHILDELSKIATCYGFIDKGCLIKEISSKELLNCCKKCMTLTLCSTKKVPTILEQKFGSYNYRIISDKEVEIYDDLPITDLTVKLNDEGISIIKLEQRNENLESYFINLVGGKN